MEFVEEGRYPLEVSILGPERGVGLGTSHRNDDVRKRHGVASSSKSLYHLASSPPCRAI